MLAYCPLSFAGTSFALPCFARHMPAHASSQQPRDSVRLGKEDNSHRSHHRTTIAVIPPEKPGSYPYPTPNFPSASRPVPGFCTRLRI